MNTDRRREDPEEKGKKQHRRNLPSTESRLTRAYNRGALSYARVRTRVCVGERARTAYRLAAGIEIT